MDTRVRIISMLENWFLLRLFLLCFSFICVCVFVHTWGVIDLVDTVSDLSFFKLGCVAECVRSKQHSYSGRHGTNVLTDD